MVETTVWRNAFDSWWATNGAGLSYMSWVTKIETSYGAGYEQGCADTTATAIVELRADVKRIREMLEKPK